MKGIIFDIKRFAIHDGPGIRTTIFFKGCPLDCRWCHNPESINPAVTAEAGEIKTVNQVMTEIKKESIFYEESGGGVTFSGGEPAMQHRFLGALLDECKAADIHTAVDTSGSVAPNIFNSFINRTDLFLYDLKIIDEKEHLKYTGASNRLVLENIKTLSREGKETIIRFPVIPGITDGRENVNGVIDFISALEGIDNVVILPFHRTAAEKYRRLSIENRMKDIESPSALQMEEIIKTFESSGLKIFDN
ncbi:MAG: glycyl-radical enzyme activating protein [bacterium]|nr:glycyl-radical enzyme activating protein [bacterium]